MSSKARFLAAKERIERLKREGITLFPGMSNENKAMLLYINDEPIGITGFTNPSNVGNLVGEK